jgi:ribosomal RNA-processing protein 9
MPDAFFAASKSRKRKRATSGAHGGSSVKKFRKAPQAGAKVNGAKKISRAMDEELDSDRTHDGDGSEIDDMDLRVSDVEESSGDEVEDETPAEKRLRLAKLYLETVKGDLGEYNLLLEWVQVADDVVKLRVNTMLQILTRSSYPLD